MVRNGKFTLAALRRLNAIMLNAQEKGRAFDTMSTFTADWTKADLWATRAAMFAIFENGPLLREFDRVVANHKRPERKPYPPRARRFSVFPDELPERWQAAFRDVTPDMAAKVAAASLARRDLVVIARTDAAASEGIEGAVARAELYVEAGADAIFPRR